MFTIAPLDEYLVRVPIYDFDEFKRLKKGLKAVILVGKTEFTGVIDRLGATTQEDRWGRASNYALVRFKGDGTLGILGLDSDGRLTLPPPEERAGKVTSLLDMHGNVLEWCLDTWTGSFPGGQVTDRPSPSSGSLRVARGGSWLYEARYSRSANRDDYSPYNQCSDLGFRIVLAP